MGPHRGRLMLQLRRAGRGPGTICSSGLSSVPGTVHAFVKGWSKSRTPFSGSAWTPRSHHIQEMVVLIFCWQWTWLSCRRLMDLEFGPSLGWLVVTFAPSLPALTGSDVHSQNVSWWNVYVPPSGMC